MHIKRINSQKFWPVPRKGTKYLAVPSHNKDSALPLIIVIRDLLSVVRNKKELKRLLNESKIQINYKTIKEINYPVSLFDIVSFPETKKNYKAILSEGKKMILEEVSGHDANTKIYKVIGKKMLANNKLQLNLMHGKNILTNEKANTDDSVLFNLKENKIEHILKMEKGKEIYVNEGKHAGIFGKIEEITEIGGKKIARIKSGNEKTNVWIKNIIVIK